MSVFSNLASGAKEDAQAYIKAVLLLVADKDSMEVLEKTATAVASLLSGVTPEQMRMAEMPGKWSMAEVVQHLADSELVWGYRLRMVLAEDRPALVGYDQDRWASRLKYAEADPEAALEMFRVLRSANLRLLAAASDEDLNRVGMHAERGEESVAHMIKLYAGHDIVHIRQLERIKEAVSR